MLTQMRKQKIRVLLQEVYKDTDMLEEFRSPSGLNIITFDPVILL